MTLASNFVFHNRIRAQDNFGQMQASHRHQDETFNFDAAVACEMGGVNDARY
jgi:hypothetical protein